MPAPWSEWRYASFEDRLICRRLIRQGSRSFFAASLLLPRELRDPAYAIYAFCRLADDQVDLAGGRADAIAGLRRRLGAVYQGRPLDHPSDRALADVVEHHRLPRALFDALIEGLEWDDRGRQFETIEDLHAYAARVASTVGAIMSCLMDGRDPETLARACDLGLAMQLTNIARDVGEDARAGRLYLPRRWLVEAGIDPAAFLAAPAMSPALAEVVARLLREADVFYDRAAPGIAGLPAGCRPAINAARRLYAEIGSVVAANDFDSLNQRAVVSRRRKAALVVQALAGSPFLRRRAAQSAAPATVFLVDAATRSARDDPDARDPDAESRAEWVLGLFMKLKRRDRLRDMNAGTV
ncbi:MAG TPA: phytoene/squalene synthase family protein [Kiloniellaceae bacterium]|nr:phytoene/squalene synthase family protein [Kiloniellaceae bacterium]